MNKYRHEVTEIRIECWPLGGTPGDTSTWPEFMPGGYSDDVIDYSVMAGGGQIIKVPRLTPSADPGTATGRSVGSWRLVSGGATEMEFTVDWLDHDRRGRRLSGVANLADFAVITTVMLNPPDPLTSPAPD